MEIIIVLLLILLNGIFAMSEIAIISAKRTKLQQRANNGDKNAEAALNLTKDPNRFLSTVQIGITLIGIFAGAFGGATIADGLSEKLKAISLIAPYSDGLSLTIVVVVITYLSLVVGELVPKRIGLNNPVKLASLVARPMYVISQISAPFVSLLSFSTEWVLRLLRIKPSNEPSVSEEEVRMMIREGTKVGIFEKVEKDIVERTLRLGDKKVQGLMSARKEIVWLDKDSSFTAMKKKIIKSQHSHFPVCGGSLDKVIGIVRTEDLLTNFLRDEKIDLLKYMHKPLFIPESMDGLHVLEVFKKSGIHMAIVIDEYGNVQGVVTLTDILEAIVGDIPSVNEHDDKEIVKRNNGTYFIDGLLSIDEFKDHFHLKKLPDEKSGIYHTVGGFVMHMIGRIPVTGDTFAMETMKFEVVDMDGTRVDKVLVKLLK